MDLESRCPQRVLVVGGGLAGLRVAQGLALKGQNLGITLVGDEPHMPYNRPPLTKSDWRKSLEMSSLRFPAKSSDRFELHLGMKIRELRPATGTATGGTGNKFIFDTAVVATGLVPRRALTVDCRTGASLRQSVALRTLDDHRTVRSFLRHRHHVVILGAGFVGCEVASSLSAAGHRVTLIGRHDFPMMERLGRRISEQVHRRILKAGVHYVVGVTPTGAYNQGRGVVLELSDGSTLPADLVIEALGSQPDLSFWAGDTPEPGRGLPVDHHMRVLGTDNVYAVGDVAEIDILENGHRQRHEHWATAVDTARIAVDAITSPTKTPPPLLPSSWSDQFGLRIQTLGLRTDGSIEHDLSDDPQTQRFRGKDTVVTGFVHQGRLTGIVAVSPLGQPSPAIAWREDILESLQQAASFAPYENA